MLFEVETRHPMNVKYVKDSQGRAWICYADVAPDSDYRAAGCVPAERVDFERMFGGRT